MEPPPRPRTPAGRRRPVTEEELRNYLFGDPRVRDDVGVVGRLTKSIEDMGRRVDRFTRLAWAVLLALLAALLTLLVQLATSHHG